MIWFVLINLCWVFILELYSNTFELMISKVYITQLTLEEYKNGR